MALGPAVLVAVVLGIALAAALVGLLRPRHANGRAQTLCGPGKAGEAGSRLLHLPPSSDGGRDYLCRPGHRADPRPRRGPAGHDPGRSAVRGVALYLLGHNAFRLRDEGSVSVSRLVVAVVCLALIAVAVSVPSIITLAVLTGAAVRSGSV